MRLVRWVISGLMLGALGGFLSGLLRQRRASTTIVSVSPAPLSADRTDDQRAVQPAVRDGAAAAGEW
jgi:hypothetical protein